MDIMNIQNHAHLPNAEEVRRRLSPIQDAREVQTAAERQAIQDAAEAFESYFIQIMLREMRRTIPDEGGLIPTSQAERVFTEMLDEEIAKEAARSGGIGLAQVIVNQMTRDAYMSHVR
jgi:flagellar protein FlgJ